MSTAILRKELHEAIDRITDQRALKAFRSLIALQAEADEVNSNALSSLTEKDWEEIERRHSDYVSGRVKFLSLEEFIKKADGIKKKFRKKPGDRSASTGRV